VGIFPLFKKKHFFSAHHAKQIEEAIRMAETKTSGQIRLYVESKNPYMDPLERAKELFLQLNMHQTRHRNAVLMYIAIQHHELAIFADEGIYKEVGKEFWDHAVQIMISHFKGGNLVKGIEHCIQHIGDTLKEKFPHNNNDTNELSSDIVFGD